MCVCVAALTNGVPPAVAPAQAAFPLGGLGAHVAQTVHVAAPLPAAVGEAFPHGALRILGAVRLLYTEGVEEEEVDWAEKGQL